jgi:hypothetical protein
MLTILVKRQVNEFALISERFRINQFRPSSTFNALLSLMGIVSDSTPWDILIPGKDIAFLYITTQPNVEEIKEMYSFIY